RSSSASDAFSWSPSPATSASSGATSSPFALAWPMALLRVLRRFCSSCVRTCSALRSPSRRSSAAASRTKPRVSRRRCASAAGSWRRRLGSSIVGASEVAERGIIACRVHVCPAHAWQNRAKPPDAPRMPEASRRSALPLPTGRGWWIVAAGLALGLVAFLAIWLSQRGDDALYRADQQPPAAAPPVFSPLPVPPAPGEVDVDEPIP